jgi:hypothetical protein
MTQLTKRDSLYRLLRCFARLAPASVTGFVRRLVPSTRYDRYLRKQSNPFADEPNSWDCLGSRYTLGIIKDHFHYHKHYIRACREMGFSYRVLDVATSDWIEGFQDSDCDAFLVWPSTGLSVWKDMFDDRLRVLQREMDQIVYPQLEETWLYDSKLRQHYWVKANDVPHPRTWVFYDRQKALAFAEKTALPIVFKTNSGASASGVFILRSRSKLVGMIRRAFTRGVTPRRHNPRDRQWHCVLLQEYLRDVTEWRLVRIGDSYFGHTKGRNGNFHSGSGVVEWNVPERRHLEFLKSVTDKGSFTSMDVDAFEVAGGRLLVNELQTVFGAGFSVHQLEVHGKPGRFTYREDLDEWLFEEGDFARNACANARVDYLVNVVLPEARGE